MARSDSTITIKVDTTEAVAAIEHLRELIEGLPEPPEFQFEELEELTWHWPWWTLFLTSVGGGVTVLVFAWLVATVSS